MKKKKYLIIGIISVFVLWILSWILLTKFISTSSERGQFGDMFGAVNSLFSGLALCGVAYTIFLQYESNRNSQSQFRFNHLLDTTNHQIVFFNHNIEEYTFNVNSLNDTPKLKFNTAMEIYKSFKDEENKKRIFNDINQDSIHSLFGFIHDSFGFVFDLIENDEIDENDKIRLKKLYKRSINKYLIEFLSVVSYSIEVDKQDLLNRHKDLQDIGEGILKLKKEMLLQIINNYL